MSSFNNLLFLTVLSFFSDSHFYFLLYKSLKVQMMLIEISDEMMIDEMMHVDKR